MRFVPAVVIALLCASPLPALAAAITYSGTIGKLPVIVEIASPGTPIVAKSLLRGWLAKDYDGNIVDPDADGVDSDTLTYGPDDKLLDYAVANRVRFDPTAETDCGYDDLAATNLGVTFSGDNLVFTLRDLPNVVSGCTEDLLEVPLKDARPLLTEAGAAYFAELDQ